MTPERQRQVALVVSAAKNLELQLDRADRFEGEAGTAIILPTVALRFFEEAMADWRRWCKENPHG